MVRHSKRASASREQQQPSPGQRVRQERVRQGLTQEDLAERAERHINTIRNLEADKGGTRRTIEAVAATLKTTPEALGFRLRQPLKSRRLTPAQREIIDELLSLPVDEQERVREVVAALRAQREKRGRR